MDVKIGSMKMTEEDARRCGMMPEQRIARFKRMVSVLKKHGKEHTEFFAAVNRAAKAKGENPNG